MAWSYKPLWIQLVNKEMNRTELRIASGITSAALAKMGKNQPVTLECIGKICKTLGCKVEDVVLYRNYVGQIALHGCLYYALPKNI